MRLRRAVGPVIGVCKRLEHADLIVMDNEMKPLFRDVLDHAKRAEEDIDSRRRAPLGSRRPPTPRFGPRRILATSCGTLAGADKEMRLAEGDLIFRHLSRPRHDEQRVAVLLDFWLLMGVRRVLNRQRMQMELGRDASEQLRVRLVQTDPNNVPLFLRPVTHIPRSECWLRVRVDAGGHDARLVRG